ncbi:MAG: M48 family metallopeptidase [Alphaproteobacteria bacterium]|jgi:STE24 endopeptidase|nr:M48 family metallopeptidase [Alphaproteobacteria bacterium]MDP7182369.1 M48 family metallopeptidase [Alphaproteobacteria bacterium]MDP7190827.1 M48 family metallopeptidase [Alphaproteobacteria bacterium]HJO88228.1 M48 family metallopeptidase [Alphaproteobacteria bacterium]
MEFFTGFFLCFLFASLSLELWLGTRQIVRVRSHRAAIPEDFKASISLENHQKAADYTITKTRLNLLALPYGALLLLAWTLGGGIDLLDGLWRASDVSGLFRGTGVLLCLLVASAVLRLPFTLYGTFVIEERFGFNRTTAAVFLSDCLKSLLLLLAIGTPLICFVLWLMETSEGSWWLHVWGVWTCFLLLNLWLYPRFIAPLFNKFTLLKDETLKVRIGQLAERCGLVLKEIFVMDGSRRSSHGNAYFTGFGRNKRIVFFDTLLTGLGAEEIEAVLAHELGHFNCHHVPKLFVASAILALAGLMTLGWLADTHWFYSGLGVSAPSKYMALALFILIVPMFMIFIHPLTSLLSRRFEYEADRYAAANSDVGMLVQALVKLYQDNASTLTPDHLYSTFYHSHPPPAIRLARLKGLAAGLVNL